MVPCNTTLKPLSQFRRSRHWAVTLRRWPCLLHPYTSVGRGRETTLWHCSKWVDDVGRGVLVYLTCAFISLGGRGEISMDWSSCKVRLYMLTSDLTSLVAQQFSHWLQVRKVGTPCHHRHFKDLNARCCRWRPVTEQWRQKIKNNNNKKIQLNLSTTATLGTEETGHCREVETRVNVWTVRQKMWPLGEVWLYFISSFWFFGENYRNFIRYFLCSRNWEPKTLHFD